MPIHEEKPWPRMRAVLFLALAFMAVYWPLQLGRRELHWREGFYGTMAQEMNLLWPHSVAHGEVITGEYPLYPWAIAILQRGMGELGQQLPLAFWLRLVSVLSLAATTILVWLAGRQAISETAGAVASAACISMLLPMEKAIEGYPQMLAAAWLCAGWLSWFHYGVARGQWQRAWTLALSCCGMGFYTIGWQAVLFFVFPLLWLRRPMSLWHRRPGRELLAGLAILCGFILLWGVPRWFAGGVVFRQLRLDPGAFSGSYLMQLAAFPLLAALRLMPWTLLAWPAFCAAYEPLDPNPLFGRYLKTIFCSLLLLLWINPYTDTRELLFIVPPLALLIGQHYCLLVRRHGGELHRLTRGLALLGIAAAAVTILFYLLPPHLWQDLPLMLDLNFWATNRWSGLALGGVALLAAGMLSRRSWSHPLWVRLLGVCACGMLIYWALFDPYRAQDREHEQLGLTIRARLRDDLRLSADAEMPANTTVYVFRSATTTKSDFFNVCCHLGCRVQRFERYPELPADQPVVYVLGMDVPAYPERQWGEPLLITNYAGKRLYFYKGRLAGDPGKPTP